MQDRQSNGKGTWCLFLSEVVVTVPSWKQRWALVSRPVSFLGHPYPTSKTLRSQYSLFLFQLLCEYVSSIFL